jgi:hypothetical protein
VPSLGPFRLCHSAAGSRGCGGVWERRLQKREARSHRAEIAVEGGHGGWWRLRLAARAGLWEGVRRLPVLGSRKEQTGQGDRRAGSSPGPGSSQEGRKKDRKEGRKDGCTRRSGGGGQSLPEGGDGQAIGPRRRPGGALLVPPQSRSCWTPSFFPGCHGGGRRNMETHICLFREQLAMLFSYLDIMDKGRAA